MRKALCIKDLNDFNLLADGKIETIKAQLVDRDICECVENGWIQVLPYVSFSYLDVDAGRVNFVTYRRPDTGEGEERLQGRMSAGFGGHIDNPLEVYHTETSQDENGDTIYHLTVEDIKQTAITCAVRELKEELGFNPFEKLEIGDDSVYFNLEREQEPDDVGKVHLCLSIKVNLSADRYADFFNFAKPNEAEIHNLQPISIDLNSMIKSFNMAAETNKMVTELESLNAESWTRLVIVSTLATIAMFVRENFHIKTILDDVEAKRRAEAQAAKAEQEAQQKAAEEAKAAQEAVDPAVITDVDVKPAEGQESV